MTQQGEGGGWGTGRSTGAAISAPATTPPRRAGAQRGSDRCEAGGRVEQRAMCVVFHGNPAPRTRGAAPVRWRSEQAPRPAGVANNRRSRCSDTLALGSGLATRRAAVSPGVLTIGAERLHNGATVGLTSLDCGIPTAGRPAWWCCGGAVGLTGGRRSEDSATAGLGCAQPEAPWATRRSRATRRTPTLVGQRERPPGTT